MLSGMAPALNIHYEGQPFNHTGQRGSIQIVRILRRPCS